ncbi:MAG: hypothetical protein H0X02_03905 [Nitrosomonas sp.]|nr:hypothetical protein [Nitrosomonas sp.]
MHNRTYDYDELEKNVIKKVLENSNINVDGTSPGLIHGNGGVFGVRHKNNKVNGRTGYEYRRDTLDQGHREVGGRACRYQV